MNISTIYLIVVFLALMALAFIFFFLKPPNRRGKLSLLAALSFAFVLGGVFFGAERWLGYGLMAIGVVLAVIDIILKYRLK